MEVVRSLRERTIMYVNTIYDMLLKPRKRFAHWLWVKRDLEDSEHIPPFFKEGEVWWCHVGENVEIEINGKGEEFTRPFLIFKKYDRESFLGLPLTTVIKSGSKYVQIQVDRSIQCINLAQGRTFDYRRLHDKHGVLSINDFKNVERGYAKLHLMQPL